MPSSIGKTGNRKNWDCWPAALFIITAMNICEDFWFQNTEMPPQSSGNTEDAWNEDQWHMQFWPPILVHPLPKLKFQPNGVGNPRFRVWIHVKPRFQECLRQLARLATGKTGIVGLQLYSSSLQRTSAKISGSKTPKCLLNPQEIPKMLEIKIKIDLEGQQL